MRTQHTRRLQSYGAIAYLDPDPRINQLSRGVCTPVQAVVVSACLRGEGELGAAARQSQRRPTPPPARPSLPPSEILAELHQSPRSSGSDDTANSGPFLDGAPTRPACLRFLCPRHTTFPQRSCHRNRTFCLVMRERNNHAIKLLPRLELLLRSVCVSRTTRPVSVNALGTRAISQ